MIKYSFSFLSLVSLFPISAIKGRKYIKIERFNTLVGNIIPYPNWKWKSWQKENAVRNVKKKCGRIATGMKQNGSGHVPIVSTWRILMGVRENEHMEMFRVLQKF